MFRATAYDTTACQGHVIEPLKQAVLNAIIQGNLQPHPNNPDVVLVQGGLFVNETIKSFAHPMAIGHGNNTKIAVDVRNTGKYDPVQESFVVRDKEAYQGLLLRAHLTDLWVNHSPDPLRNFSNLPLQLFASWLAERVAKRLGLEVKAQTQVHILAGLFYLNSFWKDEPPAQDVIIHQIQRATRLPEDMITDVVKQVTVLVDLEALCTAFYEVTQSTRFKGFNAGLLITIVGGDWFGPNAKEVVAVSLEHPPTWLSLIWEGFNNRGMRISGLSQILERSTYRNQKDLFTNALVNLARV